MARMTSNRLSKLNMVNKLRTTDLISSHWCLLQYIGALQKKHNCGSFELLSKTAPIQAASLLVLGPYLDYLLNGRNLFHYNFTGGAIVSLLTVLAFFYCSALNMSLNLEHCKR